ncbi:ABC transporter ATP-binding protein [Candidatus Uabimicrobium amorphum]|uniref:ABC transporter ATP-binding protein n=1 Tax=Uabimicrobium amorphum TaxID=2596890 RepID=A0A5S9IK05_UABAM|nr:ABC transporter ATP-binding protein [Candidatus Uabimicrobium amorphum]BBM82470.1 ABC transporter ATP-binding protein [Candidatus Uabimicrobium amorphum]
MSNAKKIVEVIKLHKVYKDFWGREKVRAVTNLNFDVRQGEIFGLLGPNGAGKTTTIKLLLGLLFPSHGKVTIFNQSPRSIFSKSRLGFLPEESYLYPYQNAEEALTFYAKLFNLPPKIRKKRVNDLIEMVGLEKARKRFIKEYSKGMARRIGIAQALINDPEFIILDEPTSGLDPLGTREIKDLILELKKHGKTILLCSHLLSDVEDVCDRFCILYSGHKICEGDIDTLLANEDMMQVTSEKMDADRQKRLASWFAKEGLEVYNFGNKRQRLETFFLQQIEKAREEHMEQQKSKRELKEFVSEAKKDTKGQENILEQLVKTNEPEEKPEPVVEEKAPEVKVEDLLKKEAPAPEQKQQQEPKKEVDQSLIESLTNKKK